MSSCANVALSGCLAVDIGRYYNPTIEETDEAGDVESFLGSTLQMKIRLTPETADLLVLDEVATDQETGILIPDKNFLRFQIIIMATGSAAFDEGRHYFEIDATDSNGNITVFLTGTLQFNKVF